jgi:hypothetical protein
MNYSDKVSETWCHNELGVSPYDYRVLERYATLAASSHIARKAGHLNGWSGEWFFCSVVVLK